MGLAFASFSHLSGLHGYYLLKSRNPWVIRMNGVSEWLKSFFLQNNRKLSSNFGYSAEKAGKVRKREASDVGTRQ
jgi:hypothetical protein